MNFERFKYIEEGIILPDSLKADIRRKYDEFNRPYYLSVVIGVCLLITSPISVLVTHYLPGATTTYGVVILLSIVSVAVSNFIYFGMIRESYSRLLKIGDYTVKNEKENKVIGAVASIVWPLAIIIFLYNGFVNDMWSRAWIVFPITALIFGMFSAAYSIITGKNQ